MAPHSTTSDVETNGNIKIDRMKRAENPSTSSTEVAEGKMDHELDTEFLIVGCGPAGASLACFLASYGKSPGIKHRDAWC